MMISKNEKAVKFTSSFRNRINIGIVIYSKIPRTLDVILIYHARHEFYLETQKGEQSAYS